MEWWNRWIEKRFLQRMRSDDKRYENSSGETSERERALMALIDEQKSKINAMGAEDSRRGEVFSKLKKRVSMLKAEIRVAKSKSRDTRRELKTKLVEIDALEVELEDLIAQGTAQLMRPGLPLITPPDHEARRNRRRFLKNWHKVWRYPMRLGVLCQHGPRPLRRERLPQHPLPSDAPVISVVTPSYQQATFLARTMDSVLGQEYPRLEYFVADGGSTDGSAEIIRVRQGNLAGWVSEPDRGASHAINKGFTKSTGEIMAWLNSDDVWTPGLLNFAASYFAAHPEVDVVYGHRLIIDEHDHEVGHWTLPQHDGEMLLWADYIPQETMFWRRRIWDKTGAGLDESFRFAFDWELLLRFQRAGAKIVRLPWFMGKFRNHASQKSSAEISTVGVEEMARLRERELGTAFKAHALEMRVVEYQRRAAWCDRLLRWGIRR